MKTCHSLETEFEDVSLQPAVNVCSLVYTGPSENPLAKEDPFLQTSGKNGKYLQIET